MLKKIARGYGAIALAIVRFLALLAVSVGAGAVIVWPLWRLADKDPGLYTILFAVIFLAIVAILATGRIKQSFRRNRRAFGLSLARKVVILAGVCGPVLLVLAHRRLFALIALVMAFAVYGFLAFGLSATGHETSAN